MTKEKLTYEDLKLGEKAKEAYLRGEAPEFIERNCPVYLNTREVFAGLNPTDLVIAGVLGGMKMLLPGDSGWGKSQLARDIHRHYFGGEKQDGGRAITVEGNPDLDIYADVLTDFDLEKATRVLNGNHKALYWNLEEINRCPPIAQNQFFAIGNGRIIHKGQSISIGEEGYRTAIATANLGNGEFQGTFETDKGLYSRFGIVVDFDYEQFQPTDSDEDFIQVMREANPDLKDAPIRDISDLIIGASKSIDETLRNMPLEVRAVSAYIQKGLRNCAMPEQAPQRKGKTWGYDCQDCGRNTAGDSLCSLVSGPSPRTVQTMNRYAAALHFLAELKDPKKASQIDTADLMFKAFELTGVYQQILNPYVLNNVHRGQAPKMMAKVTERLKEDFRKNEDYILTSLENAHEGNNVTFFTMPNGERKYLSRELTDEEKAKVSVIDPFKDDNEIGLTWVKSLADTIKQTRNLSKKEA